MQVKQVFFPPPPKLGLNSFHFENLKKLKRTMILDTRTDFKYSVY